MKNEPAFPQSNDRVVHAVSIANSQGMTLRDYFAAKAMEQVDWSSTGVIAGADTCYELADAMLKARGK
jgi:hypothetical protein